MSSSILRTVLSLYTIFIISLLIYLPIVIVIVFSFDENILFVFPMKGLTIKWYIELFRDSQFLQSIFNSIFVASITTVISLLIGVPAAFSFLSMRRNSLFVGFIFLPFIVPWLMIGVSLLVFFSLINVPLSLLTVALGHVVYSIPLVVLVVSARLLSLNPNLERASLDLGADRPTTFKNITLPLIYPAVSVAGLIVFLWSFDNFIITFFTIGSDITFPIWMWGAIRRPTNLPIIMAASSIIIIVGSLLVYFIERYRIKRGLFTSGVF